MNHTKSLWKSGGIACCAAAGGFLLSFLGFSLLWSGISWLMQLVMLFPFSLLTYAIYRWSGGSLLLCAFVILGASPLGVLITQFQDNHGSHLMTTLIPLSWLVGMLAGCYCGKLFGNTPVVSVKNKASMEDT